MMRAVVHGDTNVGRIRTNNEDAYIAQSIGGASHWLLAAIDGLGGYEGGEIAAQIAKNTIEETVKNSKGTDCLEIITEAVLEVNNNIYNERIKNAQYGQMGCVATAAILDLESGRLFVAHVGDSRLYQSSDSGLQKLTHDHSFVGELEDSGMITELEAMSHPRRNVIERVLGEKLLNDNSNNFIEQSIFPVLPNSIFLFCSDGLSDLVTSAEIHKILQCGKKLKKKVADLINCANDKGGKDNVTVVLAGIHEETKKPLLDKKVHRQKQMLKITSKSKKKKRKTKQEKVSEPQNQKALNFSTILLCILAFTIALSFILYKFV